MSCDRPKTRRVLKDVFALVGNWAVSYLDVHPDTNTDALVARIKDLGDKENPLGATAAQLRGGKHAAYVIAVNVQVFGTFFIVSRAGERAKFRVPWDVKTVAERHYHPGDQLGYWAYLAWCEGPLTGEVHELPPSRRGRARFYVDALSHTNGNTAMKQLSIWEWRDSRAIPLVMQVYSSLRN